MILPINISTKFKNITGLKIKSAYQIPYFLGFDKYIINDAYVIRTPSKIKDPIINFKNEQIVFNLISELNISEKILYFSKINGFKLSRFVHNSKRKTNFTINDITRFTQVLKKLHNCEKVPDFSFDFINTIEVLKKNIRKQFYLDEKYEKIVINKANIQSQEDPIVFSHNDLRNENILFKNDQVKLVGFNFSCKNSLFFDIASFINLNELDEKQKMFFLKKYFGNKFRKKMLKIIDKYIAYQNIFYYYHNTFLFLNIGDIFFLDQSNYFKKKIQFSIESDNY